MNWRPYLLWGTLVAIGIFVLSGCAAVTEFERTKVNPRIDQAVDAMYARMCDLRYNTEQRFLARKQVRSTTMMIFCKRMVP